jgi:hypothetical protein
VSFLVAHEVPDETTRSHLFPSVNRDYPYSTHLYCGNDPTPRNYHNQKLYRFFCSTKCLQDCATISIWASSPDLTAKLANYDTRNRSFGVKGYYYIKAGWRHKDVRWKKQRCRWAIRKHNRP